MKKEKNKLQFRFGPFKKTYFFQTDVFGLVFERGPRAVCIYITDKKHSIIFAAIPMGYDKHLRKFLFTVGYNEEEQVFTVEVGVLKILIDVRNCRVTSNKNAKVFGSEIWGFDCSIPWTTDFEKYFKGDEDESNLHSPCKQAEG